MPYRERHQTERVGWPGTVELGANGGMMWPSLIIGVAEVHAASHEILIALRRYWVPEVWR